MAFVCVTCPRICCSVRQHVYGAYLFVISASGRSIVQRSPTECDVSEYDPASSILRGPWPTGGCCGMAKISTVSVGAAPCHPTLHVRARSKRDGTRAETRFRLSEKRTSPFKSAGGGGGPFSRLLAAEVCASAVVMLDTPCSEVQCKTTGYPLHLHVSPSLPLPCVTVCHQVSTEVYIRMCFSRKTKPLFPCYESVAARSSLLPTVWTFARILALDTRTFRKPWVGGFTPAYQAESFRDHIHTVRHAPQIEK